MFHLSGTITIDDFCYYIKDWINYIAVDEGGQIYGYSEKPCLHSTAWHSKHHFECITNSEVLYLKPWYTDWRKSLVKVLPYHKANRWKGKLCCFWQEGTTNYSEVRVGRLKAYENNLYIANGVKYAHCAPLTEQEALALVLR